MPPIAETPAAPYDAIVAEAHQRASSDLSDLGSKRAQPCRDLAGGQTGAFAEEHAHDIIPDIPGSLAPGLTLTRYFFTVFACFFAMVG